MEHELREREPPRRERHRWDRRWPSTRARRQRARPSWTAARPARPGTGPACATCGSPGGVEHAAAAIHAAAEQARAPGSVGVVCVGLSGFADALPDLERLAAELARRLGAARVVIASDVVTSYLGALGLRPGVVMAAGTGSVALAADGAGAVAFVDGWGHLLGDAGSGFAIGQAGLAERAARGRRAWRVRGAAGARGGGLRARWAICPRRSMAARSRRARSPPSPRRWPTRRTPATRRRARSGRRRPASWPRTVVAAAERTFGAGAPADVSWAGGLFAAEDLLRAPFARRLAERAPRLRVVAPEGTSLDGARLLVAGEASRIFPGLIWASGAARP